MWRLAGRRVGAMVVGGLAAVGLVWWLVANRAEPPRELVEELEAADSEPPDPDEPLHDDKRKVSDADRTELMTRAHVWRRPRVPVHQAPLTGTALDFVSCKFELAEPGGTTPKFDCELENGEEVRIKYGNGPEVPAEAAATRLLTALGFAADDVTLVERLRCYGCPEEPFSIMKTVGITRTEPLYERLVNYDDYEDFEWVALERKFNARPVETDGIEGWGFFELDVIDPARGGAPRAHVDALRVMAVLLAHWDNKMENQRLVCLSRTWPDDGRCGRPFLILQDVGATFGPTKLDLAAWERAPIWEDRATCTISMRELPFEGATFGQARVSEPGRQFIGGLLSQLTDPQLTDLFAHARFGHQRGLFNTSSPVSEWVRVFKEKVHAITDGPACPEST